MSEATGFYGEVVSSRRPTLTVRSEIEPTATPSRRYLVLPKNNVCAGSFEVQRIN